MNINAVWIGPELGSLHAACLRSFVKHGYRTILHCYEKPLDAPEGIEFADAADLLPREKVVRHTQEGSLALTSDLMSYEILRRGLGLYVDCDVLCVRPIEDADYIFGWESQEAINCAVLKLPPDCPALESLSSIKDEPFIPPWLTKAERRRYRWRSLLRRPIGLGDMPWGWTGPSALTWYLRQHGLERHAQPVDAFYPLHWQQTSLLYDPGLSVDDIVTPRTRLVHLYAHALARDSGEREIPASSPLGRILRR